MTSDAPGSSRQTSWFERAWVAVLVILALFFVALLVMSSGAHAGDAPAHPIIPIPMIEDAGDAVRMPTTDPAYAILRVVNVDIVAGQTTYKHVKPRD